MVFSARPSRYTLIKLRLVEPLPAPLQALAGRPVFLVTAARSARRRDRIALNRPRRSQAAATLRPETMYGQTNCYILPTGDYGAFAVGRGARCPHSLVSPRAQINGDANGDVLVMSDRAALNLAYQGYAPAHAAPKCLARITGARRLTRSTRNR